MTLEAPAGPLAGLRVIDLGQLVAAPTSAALMADLGADVVKVERPGPGDPLRELGSKKGSVSLWWKAIGRNKRSIALDLKSDQDRELFLELVQHADVVVENFVPGTMEDLGIGYDVLRARNPRLVLLSISGFGQTGPFARQTAFGRTAEAFSGLAYITGFPDLPPLHSGLPIADYIAGVMGAFAIMAALRERDQVSGLGQHIDLALYEAVFKLLEYLPVSFASLGFVTERLGSSNAYVAPVGTYPTGDGKWASLTGSTQDMVVRIFRAIGRPELIEDDRFKDAVSRVAHRDELDAILTDWMLEHGLDEVCEIFGEHAVAISRILSIADIFENEHYRERGVLVEVPDDELGGVVIPAVVPRFSRTPGEIRHAGRPLDSGREQILRDWLGPEH